MQNNYSYLTELMSCVSMDGPLHEVPRPRWESRAARESSLCNTSNSVLVKSFNASLRASPNKSQGPSPRKSLNVSAKITETITSKTPKKQGVFDHLSVDITSALPPTNLRKTPSKTPKKSPKSAKTPTWGDRFIPNRSGTDYSLSNFLVMQQQQQGESDSGEGMSHVDAARQRIMKENLFGGDVQSNRILEYKRKAPAAPEGHMNNLRMVYTSSKTPASKKKGTRAIPSCPEKVLDAPDIMDDYYLNLLDWSKLNILAVALRNSVYLWNETTGTIQQLMELDDASNYISSVSWVQEGNILAIGDSHGAVQLWDCGELKRVRTMRSHSGRVSSLSWNFYICTSGSRTGAIHHHDVRVENFLVGQTSGHTQEVCGLKWCPNGNYLASGGNDNLLNVWARTPADLHPGSTPLHSFSDHQAAVKALAWCPWQNGVLASGGGTADRHIRFWNCRLGTNLHAIDTHSQISSIIWSPHYKELISSHGFANNELIIWKYPTMEKVAELVGHTQRVLNLCLSPDGTTVLSAGADETIRLWKVFQTDAVTKKSVSASTKPSSLLNRGIR